MAEYKDALQTRHSEGTGTPVRTRENAASAASHSMGAAMGPILHWLHDVAAVTLLKARRTLFQAAILFCVLGLLLWVSIFLYGTFYYSYMPTVSFSTPVHFYYTSDCATSEAGLCSFPTANISFLRNDKDQVMAYGQPYRVSLELEMPESPVNEHLGMFMVRMSSYAKDGKIVSSVGRSTMLHYRSSLLQTMSTLFFSPLLVTGMAEQKQLIEVELYSDYKTNANHPTVGAVIQIQSKRVQIYSSQLRIHAYFTGIRYIIYNFPVTSAVIGVATNFAFLSVVVLFGYLQFIWGGLWPPDHVRVNVMMGDNTRLQQRREDARKRMERENSQKDLGSPKVVGSVIEAPDSQGNGTEADVSPQRSTVLREACGADLPIIEEKGSLDSKAPDDEDNSEMLDECFPPPDAETTLRQRPGPWMSL
ncbi:seipin-like [Cynoglossus semilaevis]|uniref:Seipin n=1 Tax=Cynoglossus semilaevis TaxID=244447 RepID=A0A3P8WC89_CYNSE|nr:seipin-like [Cynoglossus semilaevis]XP_016886388.1 seipin-like [Cynoglossus semilaevis]